MNDRQGEFATEYGSNHRCLVKLGCKMATVGTLEEIGMDLSPAVEAAVERAVAVVREQIARLQTDAAYEDRA